jgi:hypothetical protein
MVSATALYILMIRFASKKVNCDAEILSTVTIYSMIMKA